MSRLFDRRNVTSPHDLLNGTSKGRLKRMKRGEEGVRLSIYQMKERRWRAPLFGHAGCWESPDEGKPSWGKWRQGKRAYYCADFVGFRVAGDAHEIARREGSRMDHTGWYCDLYQSETVVGVVLQLPSRKGMTLFVPALRYTGMDGVTIFPTDHYESELECAKAADQYAESEAEKEREYQMGEEVNRRIEESKEEIHHNREEVSDLLSDVRDLVKQPAHLAESFTNLMKPARRRIISLRERNHKLLKEMKILKDRPWELIHY